MGAKKGEDGTADTYQKGAGLQLCSHDCCLNSSDPPWMFSSCKITINTNPAPTEFLSPSCTRKSTSLLGVTVSQPGKEATAGF